MKRDDLWNERYNMVWNFVAEHHRGPTRHHSEEATLLNWMKFNRKKLNRDVLEVQHIEKFKRLMAFIRSFHRVNQFDRTPDNFVIPTNPYLKASNQEATAQEAPEQQNQHQ